MRKLFSIFLFLTSLFSKAQVTFQKTYGGGNFGSQCSSLQQTNDSGFVLVGRTGSFGAGSSDVYLIKTDGAGNILWTKTFGGTGPDGGNSVRQTSDGGFILSGWTESFSAAMNIYLIKTDANGNMLWSKTFGGSGVNEGYSAQETNDGGFILAGYIHYFGAGNADAYLVKTNSIGDTLWTKTFGGTSDDWGYSTQQTSDGGFVIAGETNSFGAGNSDTYLIKTDGNGNMLWSKTFGGTGADYCNSVQQTIDGGFILSGTTASYGAVSYDLHLIKTNPSGNIIWSKTFGGSNADWGWSSQQTTDGGYVIAGETNTFGAGYEDIYLIKTDLNGDTLWTKAIGSNNPDMGYFSRQTKDGGLIIVGQTINTTSGNSFIYLVKTDSDGNNGCYETNTKTIATTPLTIATNPATKVSFGGVVGNPSTQTGSGGIATILCMTSANELKNELLQITIFPNPFSTETTLSINGQLKMNNGEFIMYDVFGREVKKMSIVNYPFTIQRNGLPSGMYFYKVSGDEKVLGTGKVVIE